MNMKVLDQLVAETIMEPATISSMENGAFAKIMDSFDFNQEIQTKLKAIGCNDFNEFVAEAFNIITEYEAPSPRIRLPSAAEGIKSPSEAALVEAIA